MPRELRLGIIMLMGIICRTALGIMLMEMIPVPLMLLLLILAPPTANNVGNNANSAGNAARNEYAQIAHFDLCLLK